jgi:hypothetical protein
MIPIKLAMSGLLLIAAASALVHAPPVDLTARPSAASGGLATIGAAERAQYGVARALID